MQYKLSIQYNTHNASWVISNMEAFTTHEHVEHLNFFL